MPRGGGGHGHGGGGEGRQAGKAVAEPGEFAPPLLRTTRRLLGLVGGLHEPAYRWRIVVALALTLLGKVLAVFSPLILADGINKLARGHGEGVFEAFAGAALFWSALRFASTAAPQLRDAIFQPVSEEAQRRAGTRVFGHVHSLSVRFHQSKRTGAVYRTIERGVRAIDFLLRFLAFNIAPTLVEFALAAGVLTWRYGPAFAVVAFVTIVIYAWMTFGVTEWRLKHRREMNEADSEAAGRAVDSLLNFETVKSFAAEQRESDRYDRALASYAQAAVKSNTSLVLLNVVQGFVMALGLVGMVLAAGYFVAKGHMGPGDITAVIMIMTNLYAPLNILGFAYREIKQTSIDMEKMFTLLDERPDVADAPGAPTLRPERGEAVFEAVSFAHEGRDNGLDGVSFTAHAGETTAIVGPSGAGKSTILKLLYRFYDPASGRVLIDGQDLKEVTQTSLRSALGLVPQDVVLFNDTIRYNIGYGRPEATQLELEEAAARAQLLDFIESLPQGWDTRVGERGLKLSGGEKQRVGIARVVLKNPRILILDEATSSLDSATEADVQAALEAAARGRTTVVVAHRLSTIANADQIVVLDQGRVVERGTHASLIARDGLYASLWKRQAEEPRETVAAE
jgi:ATP-binding cassette subfamily B protein